MSTSNDVIWQDWLSRASTIPIATGPDAITIIDSDDHFVEALKTCTLSSWDHLTHVRIAWIYILRHGLEKGFAGVDEGIDNYIKNSDRTNGKTFHPTMTRFWCHMVAFWFIRWQLYLQRVGNIVNGDTHAFHQFLEFVYQERDLNLTDIASGGLFKSYYSQSLMFSRTAKAAVTRPDLRSLPDFSIELEEVLQGLEIVKVWDAVSVTHLREDVSYLSSTDYWISL